MNETFFQFSSVIFGALYLGAGVGVFHYGVRALRHINQFHAHCLWALAVGFGLVGIGEVFETAPESTSDWAYFFGHSLVLVGTYALIYFSWRKLRKGDAA